MHMNQVRSYAGRAFALCFLFAATLSWAAAPEYRAFWLDAFHSGFFSQSQVDALLGVPGTSQKGEIREANCNMIVVQVRRRYDVAYPSGVGEPYMPGLSPSDFNALEALIKAAHDTTDGKQRVEVHCWSVAFKTGKGQVYSQHIGTPTADLVNFDNYWPTRINSTTGSETADGAFDPGHPKALEYLVNTHMDLVNFQTTAGTNGTDGHIDGIHYDYIRFEGGSEGYNPTSVARFKARYGLTTEPAATDPLFRQWRRDQVSAFVRQMYARIQKTKPWVRQSGAFVTWNPSPTSSTRSAFQTTRPYGNRSDGVYSDWDAWVEEGIVDMAIPMTYYDLGGSYPNDWTRWINFEKDRKFNRHMIIGPGTYLNNIDNAITELLQTRTASPAGNYAHGFCCYSYAVPYKSGSWSAFKPRLLADVTQEPAAIPDMPWKSNPTQGHVMGTVTFAADGRWADFTQVSISGPVSRSQEVDGTGFYAFIDLPPGSYSISASQAGYATTMTNVTIAAGGAETRDMALVVAGPPGILSSPQSVTVYQGANVTFSGNATGAGDVYYQWRFNGQSIPGATGTSYPIPVVSTNDAGSYDFVVTNAFGRATSEVAVLTVIVPVTSDRFVEHWKLAPGSRSYITSATNQRGLAYNPSNGHLLVVNKVTPSVHVMDAETGNDLYSLSTDGVSGGYDSSFYLVMIGVADDGAIYACNMTAAAGTTPFKIYRWANDNPDTTPTVAYSGNPLPSSTQRWGDTLDVRGAGVNTEIIAASRTGAYVAIFKTGNGTTFTSTAVNVSGATGGDFGLGVTFGNGNSFWGKATGRALSLSSYDLSTGTGTVLRTHSLAGNIGPIGVSSNSACLAGVSIETPDNLQLYDVDASTVSLVATNPFATDNDNPHGTGAVDFSPGRVFALSTANGLLAMRYSPKPERPVITADPADLTVGQSQNAQFSVTAVGTPPLSYQWYFGSGEIPGATGSSYTRENAQAIHEGAYSVIVTNAGGSATSAPAILSVVLPPTFTAGPQSQTVIEGASATFQVTMGTEDPSVTYQWLFNGAPIATATRDTYSITSAGAQHEGAYRVVAGNLGGSATSDVATLTVLLRPVVTAQPQNRTLAVGADALFTVSATGADPLSYQWFFNGAEIAGATAPGYTRPGVVNTDAGGYSVVITNVAGKATSEVATLTVSYPSAPSVQAINRLPDQKVSISFEGGPGRFVIESSPDLFTWTNRAVINATNFGFSIEESTTAAPHEFFRIKREP